MGCLLVASYFVDSSLCFLLVADLIDYCVPVCASRCRVFWCASHTIWADDECPAVGLPALFARWRFAGFVVFLNCQILERSHQFPSFAETAPASTRIINPSVSSVNPLFLGALQGQQADQPPECPSAPPECRTPRGESGEASCRACLPPARATQRACRSLVAAPRCPR